MVRSNQRKTFFYCLITGGVLCFYIVLLWQDRTAQKAYRLYYTDYQIGDNSFQTVWICGMKNKKLESRINALLGKYIAAAGRLSLESEAENSGCKQIRALPPIVHCKSARCLSIEYPWQITGATQYYWHYCITIDTINGEEMFFEDMVDIENFAALLKHKKVLYESVDKWEMVEPEEAQKCVWYYSGMEKEDIALVLREIEIEQYAHNESPKRILDTGNDYFYLEEGKLYYSGVEHGLNKVGGDPWVHLEDIPDEMKSLKLRIFEHAKGIEIKDQYYLEAIDDGYILTLCDKKAEPVCTFYYTDYKRKPHIKEVTKDIMEVEVAEGSVCYFRKSDAKVSDIYRESILLEGKYIVCLQPGRSENEKILLVRDIFKEGILDQKIIREFAGAEVSLESDIYIELIKNNGIILKYYSPVDQMEKTEIIPLAIRI